MKCPKCGYLGFETSDRCRNCGYDFSLSVQTEPPDELPLQDTGGAGSPLADFDLSDTDTTIPSAPAPAFDLDRVIGEEQPEPLPLFQRPSAEPDDAPLITPPRPARPPLSVRRATPDLARGKTRTPRPRHDEPALQLEPALSEREETTADAAAHAGTLRIERPATVGARVIAAAIDLVLLGTIDAVVIYLTLAMAGLSLLEFGIVPIVPLALFLVLLNGGYLVVFTAANGQTIGKMATGIRVVADDGERVDLGSALLRAVGCALSLLTAGVAYLPAFVTADRRAIHDRIAGTRVVVNR